MDPVRFKYRTLLPESVFTNHSQEHSLSFSLRFSKFECYTASEMAKPYGLANQTFCYIQMLLNIEKVWRTFVRMFGEAGP